jgi:hypothetical protein
MFAASRHVDIPHQAFKGAIADRKEREVDKSVT